MKLLRFLKNDRYPDCLKIKGRPKLPTSSFKEADRLYHAFDNEDLDEYENIKLETIRFPDFSCNWSRFSKLRHVRLRKNGKKTDGCYSFTVKVSRYKSFATPVHDPISDRIFPNYSHVEVRELFEGEDILYEPPKNRKKKSKKRKSIRMEYRQNLLNNKFIELSPE